MFQVEGSERLQPGGEILDRLQGVGEHADQVVAGVVEFRLIRWFTLETLEFADNLPAGCARYLVGHRRAYDERSRAPAGTEAAGDAVGVAVPLSQAEIQTADELAPEDGVGNLDRDTVGMAARYPDMADAQLRLRGVGAIHDHDAAALCRRAGRCETGRLVVEALAVGSKLAFDLLLDRFAYPPRPQVADRDQVAGTRGERPVMKRHDFASGDGPYGLVVADRRLAVGRRVVDGVREGCPGQTRRVAAPPVEFGEPAPAGAFDLLRAEGRLQGGLGDQLQTGGYILRADRRADSRHLPRAGRRDAGPQVLGRGSELERRAPARALAAKSCRERGEPCQVGRIEFAAAGQEQRGGDEIASGDVDRP